MRYNRLGKTNLKVSRFCLGTMMFGGKTDAAESTRIVDRAIDAGVNFIDTADVYCGGKTETILGEALQQKRDRVVLASKAGMRVEEGVNGEGISRWHFVRAVEASLRRLRTDRIDLLYIHWPTEAMNLEETLRTLDDLVRTGKILYVACSNFPAWLVCRANWIAEVNRYVPLVAGQYPYNLIERGIEVEILPMAHALGFGITCYRPLSLGVLAGKYLGGVPKQARGEDDQRVGQWMERYGDSVRRLAALATEKKLACADLANAFVAAHPAVSSVIVGISRLDQLEANLAGFDVELSPEERAAIGALFPTEVREEAGGKFPEWRRSLAIGSP